MKCYQMIIALWVKQKRPWFCSQAFHNFYCSLSTMSNRCTTMHPMSAMTVISRVIIPSGLIWYDQTARSGRLHYNHCWTRMTLCLKCAFATSVAFVLSAVSHILSSVSSVFNPIQGRFLVVGTHSRTLPCSVRRGKSVVFYAGHPYAGKHQEENSRVCLVDWCKRQKTVAIWTTHHR